MARSSLISAQARQASRKARRDQLLDEAARQLNAKGVSLTSLIEIADMFGVSRAALYYYVVDRQDLVFQVYRRSCEIMAQHLGEAVQAGSSALEVVKAFVRGMLNPKQPEIAALSEIGLLRADERETVLALYDGIVARLAAVLETGAHGGEVRPCDFDVAARTIISMIYWVPLAGRWTVAAHDVDQTRLIETLNDVLENGIATPRTAAIDASPPDLSPLKIRVIHAFDRDALAEARRETILATASRLFNSKGVDATSLDEIAAELGATKRTLYHHVGDKQAIISACYERAYRIYLYFQQQSHQLAKPRTTALALSMMASALAQQRQDIAPLRPMVGFDSLSPEGQVAVAERSREMSRNSRALFEEAQREGSMRRLDPDLMMMITPGASSWLAKGRLPADGPRQLQIATEISDVIRIGLRALEPTAVTG